MVHLITSKPVIFGGLVARVRKIPIIAAISGLGHVFTGTTIHIRLLRILARYGYAAALNHRKAWVVFQNDVDRATFHRLGITSLSTTTLIKGSGVDLDKIKPQPESEGPPVVLLPARMLRAKGIVEFVEAARIIKASHPDVIFRLQGKIDTQNPTGVAECTINSWVQDGAVEYGPYGQDVNDMLAAAHIVVLPSYYREGVPKSLIDASAAGRAIITTDLPGCRDAIIEGQTGLLVPPRDSEALARAILVLLGDPERRRQMGEAARQLAVQQYDVRQVTTRHLDLYEAASRASCH